MMRYVKRNWDYLHAIVFVRYSNIYVQNNANNVE